MTTPIDAYKQEPLLRLWAHLVSTHAGYFNPTIDLIDMHEYEHRGPGTIRNHDPGVWDFDLEKMAVVLDEAMNQ